MNDPDKLLESAELPTNIPIITAKKKFVALLEPGDILLTRRVYPRSLTSALILGSIQKITNSFFTHSAMYVGGYTLIHAEQKGVRADNIYKQMDRGEMIILKPRASEEDKKAAVLYMKNAIGKPFSVRHLLLAGVRELVHKITNPSPGKFKTKVAEEEYNIICSNLIANAYPKITFSSLVPKRYVVPATFMRSRSTKKVAIWSPMSR